MSILTKIIQHKKQEIQILKEQFWANQANKTDYLSQITKSKISFFDALKNRLQKNGEKKKVWTKLIAEVKKGSPSQGLIREDFDVAEIVKLYDQYADAMSILTDEKFFLGSLENLKIARKNTNKPLLRKDFIIDEFQIYEARLAGANAVLLLASVLELEKMQKFLDLTHSLGMDALVEVHDETELKSVLKTDAKIIGINNRNLKDFSIDLENSNKLAKLIPEDKIIVSESGINSKADIRKLYKNVNAILVGTAITKAKKMKEKIQDIAGIPKIKICGITNYEDAKLAVKYGADYLGFIFYEKSPRNVSPKKCAEIIQKLKAPSIPLEGDKEGVAIKAPLEGKSGVAIKLPLEGDTGGVVPQGEKRINSSQNTNTPQPPQGGLIAESQNVKVQLGEIESAKKKQIQDEKFQILENRTKTVGVFVNKKIEQVLEIVKMCNLDVVQLHGDENSEYIESLKLKVFKCLETPLRGLGGVVPQSVLPEDGTRQGEKRVDSNQNINTSLPPQGGLVAESQKIKVQLGEIEPATQNYRLKSETLNQQPQTKLEIWKAIRIKNKKDLKQIQKFKSADGILLDTFHKENYGGTGQTFDWKILDNFYPQQKIILAGGLDSNNIQKAKTAFYPDVLDISSKIEKEAGKKDLGKLKEVFKEINEEKG